MDIILVFCMVAEWCFLLSKPHASCHSGVHGSGACSATLWRGCERITVPSIPEFMVAERAPLLYGEGVNVSLSQVILSRFRCYHFSECICSNSTH